MSGTTCYNYDCLKYKTCKFNIYEANDKTNPICEKYQSATQRIYNDYEKKEIAAGRVPMDAFHYFEW